MGAIHDRLLNALPGYFDRDPALEPGISLQYDGACRATVRHHTLSTRVTGGPGAPVTVDLTDYTLQGLADYLDGLTGYTASLLAPDGGRGAASLAEVDDQVTGDQNRFLAFTSTLWGITQPVAWALEDALDNIRAGVAEMSLKTADGPWVDLWGTQYYGAVYRNPSEGDRPYAARIIREVTRWRLNNIALEKIVEEDLGLDATVSNLHEQAWVVAETGDWIGHGKPQYAHLCFGYLAGRKYSRTTFEVLVDGTSADLARIIDRSRAAGTLPFYLIRQIVGALTDSDVPWVINTIGTTAHLEGGTSLAAVIESALIRSFDSVFAVSSTTPFILGVSELGGPDSLGDAVSVSGVSITDTAAII